MLNQGVQITPPDLRISLVRTDQQSPDQHHPILDDPRYSRLRPYTVTMRSNNGLAIHTVNIQFNVVDANGVSRSFGAIYTMPPGGMVIDRNGSCEFWPGGRMPKGINGHPLMSTLPAAQMDMIEQARSVTVSIDYVQFEDGSTAGPNTKDTPGALARAAALNKNRGGK